MVAFDTAGVGEQEPSTKTASPAGFETPDAPTPDVAADGESSQTEGTSAIDGVSMSETTKDRNQPPEPAQNFKVCDPDEALKLAIGAAVAAGDLARARALLDILGSTTKAAPFLALVKR
jgi:hypothetical protein